jgi:NADPH-dependent F420 reductase
MNEARPTICIVGGTGHLGSALAVRWASAGYTVRIGSRDGARARAEAARLADRVGREVFGGTNSEAAANADVIVVAVPYSAQRATLEDIRRVVAGKIVVDTTVPLMPPKVMRVQLPSEGCAANIAQSILGPEVRVVSAFQNVAAHRLTSADEIDCDILVFGDDKAARSTVIGLVNAIGLRGLHGGSLANSAAAEALTSVLIFINKTYAVDGAGLRITGNFVPRQPEG